MVTERTTRTRRLTRSAIGYRTELWGIAADAKVEKVWERSNEILVCNQVTERIAPSITKAKLHLASETLKYSWQWRQLIRGYNIVRVTTDHADPADRDVVFVGFLVDHEMQFSQGSDSFIVTACSNAHRLSSDTCVYGRYMVPSDSEANWSSLLHCTGLRCAFNAGGRPNRYKDYISDYEIKIDGAGGGVATPVPVFTYDGDPDAKYWTLYQAIRYLQTFYNSDETWVANFEMTDDEVDAAAAPIALDVNGKSMWEALGRICRHAGYDAYESFEHVEATADSLAQTKIKVVAWDAGTQRSVKHQALDIDDNDNLVLSGLDLEKTNLFGAQIAESSANCIASPIVAGGREIVEVTVNLFPAWDPALLNVSQSDVILAGKEADSDTETYVKRYWTRGSLFASYADVGRLWDANTDLRYSGTPYNATNGDDVGDLADYAAGAWPRMPYPPKPCLTLHPSGSGGRSSREAVLEVSFDAGSTWRPLDGFSVLPHRLGVRLKAANLASILKPGGDKSTVADTFIGQLIADSGQVKLRLTCSVISPFRRIVQPAKRSTAGTPHTTVRWFDRAAADAARRRATSSIFDSGAAGDPPADEIDASNKLTLIGERIQSALEGRGIEANLPIEWPDENLKLTDRITRIEGIGYPLEETAGAIKKYPRIVARTLMLTERTHAMSISLGSTRKAGIV